VVVVVAVRPRGGSCSHILDRVDNRKRGCTGQPSFMHDETRFTRLAMVRLGGGGGAVRRYGLARLDEIALASPPHGPRPVPDTRELPADDAPEDAPPCDL
jgi:hypothetical protein